MYLIATQIVVKANSEMFFGFLLMKTLEKYGERPYQITFQVKTHSIVCKVVTKNNSKQVIVHNRKK